MHINQPIRSVPLRRVVAWILVTILTTAVVLQCVLLSTNVRYFFITKPPPTTEHIPLYPGAQNVTVERQQDAHDLPYDGPFEQKVQVLSFETNDSREQVLAFYHPILAKDGWYSPGVSYHSYPARLPENVSEWEQWGISSPTGLAYQLQIEYAPRAGKAALVVITLIKFDAGYGAPRYLTPTPLSGHRARPDVVQTAFDEM